MKGNEWVEQAKQEWSNADLSFLDQPGLSDDRESASSTSALSAHGRSHRGGSQAPDLQFLSLAMGSQCHPNNGFKRRRSGLSAFYARKSRSFVSLPELEVIGANCRLLGKQNELVGVLPLNHSSGSRCSEEGDQSSGKDWEDENRPSPSSLGGSEASEGEAIRAKADRCVRRLVFIAESRELARPDGILYARKRRRIAADVDPVE